MVDHYRGLIKSLMQMGFLFKRQGERRHETWRNRTTEQEVSFDRDAVAKSRAAAAAVLERLGAPPETEPEVRRATGAKRPGAAKKTARTSAPLRAQGRANGPGKGRAKTTAPKTKTAASRTRTAAKRKTKRR